MPIPPQLRVRSTALYILMTVTPHTHTHTYSQNIEEQWEAEMKRLEEERLQALQREEELKRLIDNDEVVQNLDKELQSLIEVSSL